MAGWPAVRKVARERPVAPLRGYKLAYPVVSADGTRVAFGGITLGRATMYGVVADAECAQGGRHRCPSRWCDCGFYCVHTLDDARALACDPDCRHAVLLDVAVSGRYIRYERGIRYARQRITAVRVGRCACGHPSRFLVETNGGVVGWRRLVATCPTCAGTRPALSFESFSRMLAGVPVRSDTVSGIGELLTEEAPAAAPEPPPPATAPGSKGPSELADVPTDALVPLLTAEVTLLQARLDEVQRQLMRFTPP